MRDPASLLFYYKELLVLIKAVYLIYKEKRRGKTAIDLLKEKGYDVEANLMQPALYVGRYRKYTLWDYFPRNLSLEEYIDPYLVFPRFFELHDLEGWHGELDDLLSSALSRFSRKIRGKYDTVVIQTILLKFVEAAHLIDVREVGYIGDFKKEPLYTLDKPVTDIPLAKMFGILLPKDDDNIKMLLKDDDDPNDRTEHEENNDESEEGDEHDDENEDDEGEYDDEDNDEKNGDDYEQYDSDDEDDNDGVNDDESEDRQEERQDDILSKTFNSDLKNIHITIRGNYIINHPSKK